MALQSYFFQFNVTTGAIGTTYAQSGFGFQPKACILWATKTTSTTNAFASGSASMSLGFVGDVATERRCISSYHTDASGRGGFAQRNDCCLEIQATYNSIDGLLDVDSIGADGITFVVDDVFVSTYTVQGIAFGGSDITAVDLITLQGPTATGNWDTTSLGYTPSIVFFANTLSDTANLTSPGTDGNFAFGAANDTGQFSINIARNSVTSGSIQSMRYGYSGECYSFQNTGVTATSCRGAWVTSLSNGFRLNQLEGTTAYKIFALCINGGKFKVGKFSTRTDGNDIAVTSLYSQPTGLVFASHCTTESSSDTAADHAVISIGAASSTSRRGAMAMSDEDALAYTSAEVASGIYIDEVYLHPNLADSVDGYMDLKSIDANGFTCVMDDADVQANVVFYVAGFTDLTITISPASITTGQALGTPVVACGSVTVQPTGIGTAQALGTPIITCGSVTVQPTGIATAQDLGTAVVTRGGPHLLVSENFETPGYEESWTETLTGGTITDDSTGPGSLPVGGGSRCCRINHTDGTGDLFTVRDLGTNQNILYTRVYVYVDAHALASGASAHVFSLRYFPGTISHIVRIGNAAGQLGLDFRYYSGGAWVDSASVNISADTWYCVETKYDITNLAWSFSVDGAVVDSGSLASATRTSRYLYLGNNASTIPDTPALDVYFDYVKVDNAGPIGAEKEILPTAVATSEAFGTAVVTRGGVTVQPTGIVTGQALGAAVVTRGSVTIQPSSIASSVAIGTATVSTSSATQTLLPSGIAMPTAGFALGDEGMPGDEWMPGDAQAGQAIGTPVVTQGSPALQILPTGISTGLAIGTASITRGAVTIQPTGVATAVALGTAVITRGAVTIQPTGIATTQAVGTPLITTGQLVVLPSAITSTGAFGTPVLTRGAVTVQPTGIATAVALGTAVITRGAVTIQPSSIASSVALGTATLARGSVTIQPTSIASAQAIGTAVVTRGSVTVQPTGIATAVALGAPLVTTGQLVLAPSGIATSAALGAPVVARGAVTIQPTGVVSAVALGAATLTVGWVSVQPTGIVTGQGLGAPLVTTGGLMLLPQPILSAQALGVPILATGAVTLLPASIGTAVAIGTPGISTRTSLLPAGIGTSQALGVPVVSAGSVTLLPVGIASSVAIGTALLSSGGVSISPSGIATAQALGTPVVTRGAVTLLPLSIAGAAALGTPVLSVGQVSVVPAGIMSAQALGTPNVARTLHPVAISSSQALGVPMLSVGQVSVLPTGITSAQALGTPNVARTLHPVAISSSQALGVPMLSVGPVSILPTGIASSEAFGALRADLGIQFISLSGISSSEAFGALRVIDMLIGLLVSLEIEAAYGVDFEVEADYSVSAQTEDDYRVSISA